MKISSASRRSFLSRSLRGAVALAAAPRLASAAAHDDEPMPEGGYRISLAQWSLHRAFFAGEIDPLDFPEVTLRDYGIRAVEYVNAFFFDRAADFRWLGELKRRAEYEGVESLLIMIDREGSLAAADDGERRKAIENHFKWIAAARFLGCHSIRVNAAGDGSWEDTQARAADSLVRLADLAEPYGINIIVENHGGLSSNGEWLAGVMKRADHDRVGTLPDFGNFHLGNDEWYDRYRGVGELMPYAKAVSAKSHEFDDAGNEVRTDYGRMIGIVKKAGYRGFIGIEYEGSEHSEPEGIRLTKALLERVRPGSLKR